MSDNLADDLLSSVLSAYQLRAGVYDQPNLCGNWQFGTYGHKRAAYHFVGAGQCWLHTRQSPEPQLLRAGDLVVLPHDAWHMLAAADALEGDDHRMSSEGEGPFTTLVCGYFEFLAGNRNPILDALPEVIVLSGEQAGRHLEVVGQLLIQEAAQAESLGTRTVLDKLADTLFVMVVRGYVNSLDEQRGLLAALADARLRKALAGIHREPASPWTLESLAQLAGMSRTSFAQRFAELVGTTPIEYLTRWRMTQAELLLRDPQVSVASVAEQVGYETEAAFRKAFKRVHGVGPGSVRRWFRSKLGAA